MNWFTSLFEKDDWRFVGEVVENYSTINTITKQKLGDYTVTYYLYENQHGDRKFDVIDTDPGRGKLDVSVLPNNDWVFRCLEYTKTVYPWLNGFNNPDFPTYEKVPVYDFKRKLEKQQNDQISQQDTT